MLRDPIRFRRQLGSLLLCMSLCSSVALAASPLDGEPQFRGDGRQRGHGDMRTVQHVDREQRRAANRALRSRDLPMQRPAQRESPAGPPAPPIYQAPEPPPPDRSGRPGRLSPDERRALRQQIDEAGRDVYRPPGRP